MGICLKPTMLIWENRLLPWGADLPSVWRTKGARSGGEDTHLRVCRFINVSGPGRVMKKS